MKKYKLFAGICILLMFNILSSNAWGYQTNNLLSEHPRILMIQGEEDMVWQSVKTNPVWEKMHEAIMAISDEMLHDEVLERNIEGRRLLAVSREVLNRVFYLSYAYRMTGEDRYAKRAEKEMLSAAGFSDWNPTHFLDVAEMTMALAIGYDWLYHKLSLQSRQKIREAIVTKGLEPSFDSRYNWFLGATSNWNQVCNAGMTYGALAIYEDHPELASEVIDRAYRSIVLPKAEYEPVGAYPEGYGYWNYGTSFNVMFLSAADKIWPGRFDYEKYAAFMNTGSFMQHMLGPSGMCFNFGDNRAGGGLSPAMFWFARKNNDPSLLYNELRFLDVDDYSGFARSRLLPALMVWGTGVDFDAITEPAHSFYVTQGPMPLAIKRTSWRDPKAIYLAIKAGSAKESHAHMDVGSFIMEADGVRWASDLGVQSYHPLESKGMNIWNYAQDSQRWQVLRLTNHVHNTLTVNGQLQGVDGYAKIDRHGDDPEFSFAITDLSSMYDTQLAQAIRGAAVVDEEYVVIRDEIKSGEQPAVVRWKMLTEADVVITDNHTATLKKNGKTMVLRVDQPAEIQLKTYSTQPTTDYDEPNPGTMMIGFEVELPANTSGTLHVKLIPGSSNTRAEHNKGLSAW